MASSTVRFRMLRHLKWFLSLFQRQDIRNYDFDLSCIFMFLAYLMINSYLAAKLCLLGLETNPFFNLHVNRDLNCRCSHKWLDPVPLLGLQILMQGFFFFNLKIEGFKKGFM